MINMTGFNAALTGTFLGGIGADCEPCVTCSCVACSGCQDCSCTSCSSCPGNHDSVDLSTENQRIGNLREGNKSDGSDAGSDVTTA
jgi:hypothetical protein